MAKVKYIGPKAKTGVLLPIGTTHNTGEFLIFRTGEIKELSDEEAVKLTTISTHYEIVKETVQPPVEVEAPVNVVSTPIEAPIEAPKKRHRTKKVRG
jgi:hypothetical protein